MPLYNKLYSCYSDGVGSGWRNVEVVGRVDLRIGYSGFIEIGSSIPGAFAGSR